MRKKIEYINTFNMCDYKSYLEFCEINEIGEDFIAEEDSWEFNDWAREETDLEVDDFISNIKYCKYNTRCIVEGSLGRWNGVFEIQQKMFNDLLSAIYACLEDSYDYIITKIGSRIDVASYHHDGRNNFSIHILSDKGIDRYIEHGQASMNNRENFIKLDDYLF